MAQTALQTRNSNSPNGAGEGPSGPLQGTIFLVRHGETELNTENRIRGWSDVDLDEKGAQGVAQTGQLLSNLPISQIVTSDLSRSEQSSHILANHLFVPVEPSRELRPWDLGKYTQMKLSEVSDVMTKHINNPQKKVEGGESFGDFLGRWKSGLQGLVARALQDPSKAVIGVTHSRNIEATRYFLDGKKDTLVKANTVPPSGVMALQIRGGRLHEVPFANSHLEKDE